MPAPENETRLDEAALASLLASGTGWTRDGDALTKTFTFKGFKGAMAFVNQVAEAANAANHHPDIHLEAYKTVRIVLTTHVTHGLTDADVDLARKIDQAQEN
ncbi:MAG TPA: 4a-hydroxytetrahydrobiopterin dehydratase [Candidatus Limnocylindria bacterium]|jgi:4a-hydroxytetrahydrobiopterin dehydratase